MQGDVVHSHLAATNAPGYDLNVSYALYWFALETFADQAAWINFGAGAGLTSDGTDGLTRFKRGWATETRPTYFCGRIFDRAKYADALAARGLQDNDYFPAYRRVNLRKEAPGMADVIIFGTGQWAELAHFYFTHDRHMTSSPSRSTENLKAGS